MRRFVQFVRWQSTGSFFQGQAREAAQRTVYKTNKDVRAHPVVAKLLSPDPIHTADLLSPLKRELYAANLRMHNGRFVNHATVLHEGASYRLSLTREEQRALEPSMYIQSYRIKGSWKKAFIFLRMFRRMTLYDAINQCSFSPRAMAFDVGEMFERAKKESEKLGIESSTLRIEHIWVGKDGRDRAMLDFKARGRTGLKHSHYVHVKAILKPESVFEQRAQDRKARLDKRLWLPLANTRIPEEYVQTANYKW